MAIFAIVNKVRNSQMLHVKIWFYAGNFCLVARRYKLEIERLVPTYCVSNTVLFTSSFSNLMCCQAVNIVAFSYFRLRISDIEKRYRKHIWKCNHTAKFALRNNFARHWYTINCVLVWNALRHLRILFAPLRLQSSVRTTFFQPERS